MGAQITLVWFDNTDPGAGGWIVFVVWFVMFVLVLNTIVFVLRRRFGRRRGGTGEASQPIDRKEIT